ncbi:Ger(x)C family spore germination protein [Paenibacillus sp. CAA11]|uniref:Ger(x)C family spore germination protein n=1 Tax=Paenibacillus sp. CAA11 TaxID=1532905 RepID=UPI000D36F259|nr:Ger(x)C family spore germination protein [Paenibacillus sp. CAA11]AWB46479.1 Ger(x)C family spore germination protein [Paenibacillus sp. CAA11]
MKSKLCIIRLVIVMGLLSITLSGCWDRKELNELGIAVALGIDMDGEDIRASTQIVVPSEVASKSTSGKGGAAAVVFEAKAPTLLEAVQKMTVDSPRRIYLSHIRMLVISEEFARKGIAEIVETLIREPSVRSDFYIVIAKGCRAEEILKIMTPIERIPANKLFFSLSESSAIWAPTTKVTADELMDILLDEGIHPVLTGIELHGNAKTAEGIGEDNIKPAVPLARLQYNSLGVFKNDKLIGWLDEEESKGVNYIRNHVDTTVGYADLPEGRVTLRILDSSTQLKALIEDGAPKIKISVSNKAVLSEIRSPKVKLGSSEDIRRIEAANNERQIEILQEAVQTVRDKFKVDIFGFGNQIYQTNPKVWKKLAPNWDKMFLEVPVEYTARTKVDKVGTMLDTYQEKMKE